MMYLFMYCYNFFVQVIDIGCAEFGFFKFLKNVDGIEEIIEIDIDKNVLKEFSYRVHPWLSDYLRERKFPLEVSILCGNVAHLDHRLEGADAVVAIELSVIFIIFFGSPDFYEYFNIILL